MKPKKEKRNRKLTTIIYLLIAVMVITLTYNMLNSIVSDEDNTVSSNKVLFITSMGEVVIELKDNTEDFKTLIQSGVYDGTLFHRVIADFVIQGGDNTGTGYGYQVMPEIFDKISIDNHNIRGTISLSMLGNSQFFINVVDNEHLNNVHVVLGKVIQGIEVVDAIATVETDSDGRPIHNIILIETRFID